MPTKRALVIGLNGVKPANYNGKSGRLLGPENDARDMAALAVRSGFPPARQILGPNATWTNVCAEIRQAATDLHEGDLFLLTFAGHGSHLRNENRVPDPEYDDQSWCLFDGPVLDDQIRVELARFRKRVRVVVVSDSCHSGTMLELFKVSAEARAQDEGDPDHRRLTPRRLRAGSHAPGTAGPRPVVTAHAVLLAACGPEDTAMEVQAHGVFTSALLAVWDTVAPTGTYAQLIAAVRDRVRTGGSGSPQRPRIYTMPGTVSIEHEPVFTTG